MPRSEAVAVAVLLVLAGSFGAALWLDHDAANGPPADTDDRAGTTPLADSTATPTLTRTESGPDYLAPGVTAAGVVNVSLLLERHYAVLERESGNGTYVARFRTTRTKLGVPSEETFSAMERYEVRYPERRHFTWIRRNHTAGDVAVSEAWSNESVGLLRVDDPEEPVQYAVEDSSGVPGHSPGLYRTLERLLRTADPDRADNVSVDTRVRNGSRVYVVTATTRDEHATATRTFRIREGGFIADYRRVSTREPLAGDSIRTERRLTFEFNPDGTLKPPDWVDEALAAADDERTDAP